MKKIILVCLIIIVARFNLFAQVDLSNGLMAYYPFSGNAGDASGNSNHGIVTGAQLTSDRFGEINKAYRFDGNSDYINIGNSVTIKRYKSDFTFACWINLEQYSTSYHSIILSNRNSNTLSVSGSLIGIGGNPSSLNKKLEFVKNGTVTSDENTYDYLGSSENIPLNNWIFICVTYKYLGNKMNEVKLYVNGILSSTKNMGETLDPGNVNSYLGIEPSLTNDYAFKGSLDDVRIYNRVLKECEIVLLADDSNNDNSLIGDYAFSGNADDASQNANDGTVNGATLTTDRFGNANSAYSFDGINDYISLSPANLRVENYTYSAWVNIKNLPANGEADFIISIGNDGDQNILIANNYSISNSTGWIAGGYDLGGSTISYYIGGSLPATQVWYHAVVTRDNSYVRFYLNGALVGSVVASTLPYYGTSGQTAMIGTRSHGNMQYFDGKIDDVKIYNRALSACEISDLYNSEVVTSISSKEKNALNISIYPNPLSNKQSLRIESDDLQNAEMRLFNSLGEEVYQIDNVNQAAQLDLNLFRGVYILKIKSDRGELSRKIVIN